MKNDNNSCQWRVAVGKLLFVSDFTYLPKDGRAIHFKLRTRGVLYNGQFSGTLLVEEEKEMNLISDKKSNFR